MEVQSTTKQVEPAHDAILLELVAYLLHRVSKGHTGQDDRVNGAAAVEWRALSGEERAGHHAKASVFLDDLAEAGIRVAGNAGRQSRALRELMTVPARPAFEVQGFEWYPQ